MFLYWLHHHSNITILIFTVTAISSLAMIAPFVGRFLLRLSGHSVRDGATFDAFKTLMTTVGVVLAFSLVQANKNLQEVDALVNKEGVALMTTDRILLRLGKPEFAALRPELAAYGGSLLHAEWPLLKDGQRNAETDEAYGALSKSIRSIGPDDARQQSMYAELLKHLDDLADIREQILGDADDDDLALPDFFWITIAALLTLGWGMALLCEPSFNRTIGLGASAATVALLLGFVMIVDKPFEGETSVSPKSIERALYANAHRGQTDERQARL
jgi:hypothetical protein